MKLLEKIQIGPLTIQNRIVMAPMATQFADFDGSVTDQLIHYYISRAIGGVGLITTESCAVRFDGRGLGRRLGIYKDELIPGLSKLTEAVHNNGGKIVAQLHHGGRICSPKGIFEYPVSPSSVPCAFYGGQYFIGIIPRTLLKKEILEIEESFANSAKRAKMAGFDGVQIHAAHGYLINNFLSPYVNKRTDEYGGSFKNRMRFLLEIVERVRETIDHDLALLVRINGDEYVDKGYKIDDAVLIAQELESKGIDEVNISAGNYEAIERQTPPMSLPRACHVHLAEAVKKAVNIPVGAVGRINCPELAEEILQKNKADLIYMGRALIADPELPNKVIDNHKGEIRKCIACNQCLARIFGGVDVRCSVNAVAGNEFKVHIKKRKKPKTVIVVGGGPAGMEAARICAIRNNRVILFEKKQFLGGNVKIAGIPHDRSELINIIDFLDKQMHKLNVEVKIGTEFKPHMIENLNPDAVVLATGAIPKVPKIKGIKLPHVKLAQDILINPEINAKSVVIIGGGLVGCETASYLLDKGIGPITIIEELDDIAADEENISKKVLITKLMEHSVRVLLETQVKEIKNGQVFIKNMVDEESFIASDLVIIATGYESDNMLFTEIKNKYGNFSNKLFSIGDCLNAGKIYDAIHSAFNLALKI